MVSVSSPSLSPDPSPLVWENSGSVTLFGYDDLWRKSGGRKKPVSDSLAAFATRRGGGTSVSVWFWRLRDGTSEEREDIHFETRPIQTPTPHSCPFSRGTERSNQVESGRPSGECNAVSRDRDVRAIFFQLKINRGQPVIFFLLDLAKVTRRFLLLGGERAMHL